MTPTTRTAVVSLFFFFATALPSRADTLLHYDFSDGSGDVATDLSGNGNHGDLIGFRDTSAGLGVFGVTEGWVTGGGISFLDDNVRSFVETPLELSALGDPNLGTVDHTIEFIASYSESENWTPAIGADHSPSYSASDATFFGLDNNTTQLRVHTPTQGATNVTPNPWTAQGGGPDHEVVLHVAWRYSQDDGTIETFVDREPVGDPVDMAASDFDFATSLFRIANTGWAANEQWGGVMYGVAISNVFLDPEQFVLSMKSSLPGDYNGDSQVNVDDIDLQAIAMKTPTDNLETFDENSDGTIDIDDRKIWVNDHAKTWMGDADLNGEFGSKDFVQTFLAGQYEDAVAGNSTWATGDWDGDGDFGSKDFVQAFLDGGYELGPRPAAAIPEPSTAVLGLLGMFALLGLNRRR